MCDWSDNDLDARLRLPPTSVRVSVLHWVLEPRKGVQETRFWLLCGLIDARHCTTNR